MASIVTQVVVPGVQRFTMPNTPIDYDHDPDTFHRCRHLDIGFTLLNEHGLARNPTPDEFCILKRVLPPCRGIGVVGPFLRLEFSQLPRKPWPISVAGLALFMTTDMFEIPWKLGHPGRIRRHVLEDLNARTTVSRELFESVIQFYESENVAVTEVVWIDGGWRVTVLNTTDLSNLPGRICQTGVTYLVKDSSTWIEGAYRKKEPRGVLRDDTEYHPIRPGVIVASKSRSTTSGILVKDETGATHMTVASHGFPDKEVEVYHPDPNGKVIGRVVDRIGDTDIALVKLGHDIQFENRTFQSDEEPDGVWFKTIKDPFQMRRYDKIAMQNSFVGLVDGQYIAVAMRRICDTDSIGHLWVEQGWFWFGQDPAKVPREGSCGSAIYGEDGDVIAFFRFFSDDEGFGIGVAAQELLRVGYKLVVSTGR